MDRLDAEQDCDLHPNWYCQFFWCSFGTKSALHLDFLSHSVGLVVYIYAGSEGA